MTGIRWPLQFLLTFMASTFIPHNVVKTLVLVVFWFVSFRPFQKRELVFFFTCCLVFTVANYGALANRVFVFTKPDLFLMPLNELFMWGFCCLNAHRFMAAPAKTRPNLWKVLIYTISFSTIFSIVHREIPLVLILTLLLAFALLFFHTKRDLSYLAYFFFMSLVVEGLGLGFELWSYPHAEYWTLPFWSPLMWLNIGLIMSQVTTLFFRSQGSSQN